MVAEKTKILSAEQEAQLRQPIDEYVGKIQKQIDSLRADGTDMVVSLQNDIDVTKKDHIFTQEEKAAKLKLNGLLRLTRSGKSLLLMAHHAVVVHRISLLFALNPVVLRHCHRGAGNLGRTDLGLIAVAHHAGIGGVRDLVGVNRMRNLGGHAAGGLGGCADHHCRSGDGAGNRELAHGILLLIGVYEHKRIISGVRRGTDAVGSIF